MKSHNSWKQLEKAQIKEMEEKKKTEYRVRYERSMSKHVKIIFGSEENNMHHDLDIHSIPEKVIYINDLTIADTALHYEIRKQYQKGK